MPLKKQTDNLVENRLASWGRRGFNVLFLAAYALALAELWRPVGLPGKPGWPGAVLLLLAVVVTLAALARHLLLQNILLAAGLIGVAGGAADWLAWRTGIPFGAFLPGQHTGPILFRGLPWVMPVIWVLAILNSRGVARLILRPWRNLHAYGFWLIGVTTVLTVLFDLTFEPFASRAKHYWLWEPTKLSLSWQGTPLVNFFGWLVVTLLILAFVTPILINKQPARRQPADYHPLGLWLGGVLLFGIGAGRAELRSAVLLDAIIGLGVAVAAIRGGRW